MRNDERECPVEGCTQLARSGGTCLGLCGAHLQRRQRYGLSVADLGLVEGVEQCQACGVMLEVVRGNKPPIDHDHTHGHVRGVLCNACNTAEGCIRDREHAARLVAYIERTRDPNFDWAADRRAWLDQRQAVE